MGNFKNWDGDYLDDWNLEGSHWVESKGITHESDSKRDLETGKMWLYTYSSDNTNGTYKTMGVWTEQPETSHREAEININGFTITGGIVIRF
jgi:hypothetical protein